VKNRLQGVLGAVNWRIKAYFTEIVKMDDLYESLGAVYGWCWSKQFREYAWRLLYWRMLEFCGEPPQLSAVRAGGIWSGYMSEARGLSWDRKSRKDKK